MRTVRVLLCSLIFCTASSWAVSGRIFDDTEALQADATALAAEAELFKSIGMGMKLALALCEAQEACTPNVNHDEVAQILHTLNNRINDLIGRQERQEGDFTAVITAYVDQREAFQGYREELEKLGGPATTEEDLGGDTFGEAVAQPATETAAGEQPAPAAAEPAPAAAEPEVDFDVFSDVDEALD